jgi:hypothetical protein
MEIAKQLIEETKSTHLLPSADFDIAPVHENHQVMRHVRFPLQP